jgi:glycosyltransferase involved in cell wall biosynthesis
VSAASEGGLAVGSWPGGESDHNRFLPILLDALEAEGLRVTSFPESRDITLDGLDALIVHWPDKVFWEAATSVEAAALLARLVGRLAARPRRTRLVWMVHDLRPHDGRWFKRLAWPPYAAALARLADGALTLSAGTRATVAAAYPALARKPIEHVWHPFYPGEAIAEPARAAARAGLGWTGRERVYGYCGQIRPYKGVEDLIAAFAGLADPEARLLVAGRPRDEGMAADLERRAGGDPRIRLRLEDLSPEAFRACLGACDLVVAPFRRYLHSGSIVHALSAGRPVLTPATPFASSLAAELGRPDWLQTYEGRLTPATLFAAPTPATPLDLGPLAPEAAARRIRRFLEALAGARSGSGAAAGPRRLAPSLDKGIDS